MMCAVYINYFLYELLITADMICSGELLLVWTVLITGNVNCACELLLFWCSFTCITGAIFCILSIQVYYVDYGNTEYVAKQSVCYLLWVNCRFTLLYVIATFYFHQVMSSWKQYNRTYDYFTLLFGIVCM